MLKPNPIFLREPVAITSDSFSRYEVYLAAWDEMRAKGFYPADTPAPNIRIGRLQRGYFPEIADFYVGIFDTQTRCYVVDAAFCRGLPDEALKFHFMLTMQMSGIAERALKDFGSKSKMGMGLCTLGVSLICLAALLGSYKVDRRIVVTASVTGFVVFAIGTYKVGISPAFGITKPATVLADSKLLCKDLVESYPHENDELYARAEAYTARLKQRRKGEHEI